MADARQYYKSLLRKFGQLCYESWRKELFAALALTVITYALTFRLKDAWESAKIALEANFILLIGFSAFHLVRAPFLVHSDFAATFPEAESKPSRVFVRKEITPEYLNGLFGKHTAMRAEEIIAPHIGSWMPVSGTVVNVDKLSTGRFLVQLYDDPPKNVLVHLMFADVWKDKLVLLRKGDQISANGKFAGVTPLNVSLEECELEEM